MKTKKRKKAETEIWTVGKAFFGSLGFVIRLESSRGFALTAESDATV
jgi:hypothetical protein